MHLFNRDTQTHVNIVVEVVAVVVGFHEFRALKMYA